MIDLIEEGSENITEAEQVILDKHDNDVAALPVCLESLSTVVVTLTPNTRKLLSRRLSCLQTCLRKICDLIENTPVKHSVLMQCQKTSPPCTMSSYPTLNINEKDELRISVVHSALEVQLSEGLLVATPSETSASPTSSATSGVYNFWFIKNTCPNSTSERCPHLTVAELTAAETYWISVVQRESLC